MADTYTSSLRLRLQETNANVNEWGDYLNDHVITPIDFAMTAEADIDLSAGNATLTTANGTADQARAFSLNITGTGGVARTITIPSVEKPYLVRNNGTSTVLIKTSGGTGVVVLRGTYAHVYCNGSECYRTAVSGWGKLSSSTLSGAATEIDLAVTGQKFDDAMLVIKGAGHNGSAMFASMVGASGNLVGTSLSSGTANLYGSLIVTGYTKDAGRLEGGADACASNGTTAALTMARQVWRETGGITKFRLIVTAGSITGGTGEAWLR